MATPKFKVGDHVNHPSCPNNQFPAGTGTIASVAPDGTYTVKCDKTGRVLPANFKESELTLA